MSETATSKSTVWRRPKVGIAVLGGLVIVFGLGLFLVHQLGNAEVGLGVTATAFGLALLTGVPALVAAAYFDRREPEPWWILAMLFVWGAIVAAALALGLETVASELFASRFDHTAALFDTGQFGIEIVSLDALLTWLETSLIAPFVEEAVKGIAVVLAFVLMPRELNTMRDGIIVGALVGIGFAVTETTAFMISNYAVGGDNAFLVQLVSRFAVLGLSGHVVFTAIFGAGLGWARESNAYGEVRRAAIVAGTFLLGLTAHAMYNAFGPYALAAFASTAGWGPTVSVLQLWLLNLLEVLSTYAWAYVVLAYLLVTSGYRELEVTRTELRHEVPPTITPEEYSLVEDEGLWRLRRIPTLSRRGSVQLVQAQNRLAFQRDQVRRDGGDLNDDALLARRREEIAALRKSSR